MSVHAPPRSNHPIRGNTLVSSLAQSAQDRTPRRRRRTIARVSIRPHRFGFLSWVGPDRDRVGKDWGRVWPSGLDSRAEMWHVSHEDLERRYVMTEGKKVAVILSGCGVFDGAEIHEATLTLLALDLAGARAVIAAPDREQARVVNHRTQTEVPGERRNVLTEAARIARGDIRLVSDLRVSELDAAILPGGYGAAFNLSSFATAGADLQVEPTVEAFLREMWSARKPLAALCIAPPILAKVLKDAGVRGARLTIGCDAGVAGAIAALGQTHVECPATSCVVDSENRVVTSPAYMTASRIGELWQGIEATVKAMLELA